MPDKSQNRSKPLPAARWKRLGQRLALLAGSLFFTAVVLEAAVRLFTNVTPNLTEKDPLVGQRYLKSFEGDLYVPEVGRQVRLRFNSVGFRGPDRPRVKPPGVRRVAVLGDSMVASLAVEEPQTMVRQLEQLLNQSSSGVTWEVMNFGVNGASPGQELTLYRNLVFQFDPDIVLCTFFVGNDLSDNCSRLSSNPRIYFDIDEAGQLLQQPFSARRALASRLLNRYSRFYVWQRNTINYARHRVYGHIAQLDPGQWVFSRREPPDVAHAWRITAKVFEALRSEIESEGRQLAVVMIPCATQIYKDSFASVVEGAGEFGDAFDPDYPDERVAGICREAGIRFFTMVDEFRQASPSGSSQAEREWLFLGGSGHFNPQGEKLAAQAIHRFLTEGNPHQSSHRISGQPLISMRR